MSTGYDIAGHQVGNGSRHFQNAVVGSCRKMKPADGLLEQAPLPGIAWRPIQAPLLRPWMAWMPGRRAASIDFPVPGGPTINTLWPPAAAISSARFA